MSPFEQALIKAAKALNKKRIGPLALRQSLKLPLGQVHIVTVGDLDKGVLPSHKDLRSVAKEVGRQTKGKKMEKHSAIFFPPFIRIKELVFAKATLYLILLGDLSRNILPTIKDLENLRYLIEPEFKKMGVKKPLAVFYPPFLDIDIPSEEAPALNCVLGDNQHNIMATAIDIKACKKVMWNVGKQLGLKLKNIKVEPAYHSNYVSDGL